MSTEAANDSPLVFPCHFPIKAMGRQDSDFEQLIMAIINHHTPAADNLNLHARESSNGRYISLTVTINATSREQLDAIYHELSAHERVLVAL